MTVAKASAPPRRPFEEAGPCSGPAVPGACHPPPVAVRPGLRPTRRWEACRPAACQPAVSVGRRQPVGSGWSGTAHSSGEVQGGSGLAGAESPQGAVWPPRSADLPESGQGRRGSPATSEKHPHRRRSRLVIRSMGARSRSCPSTFQSAFPRSDPHRSIPYRPSKDTMNPGYEFRKPCSDGDRVPGAQDVPDIGAGRGGCPGRPAVPASRPGNWLQLMPFEPNSSGGSDDSQISWFPAD